jgi:ribonuclease HII
LSGPVVAACIILNNSSYPNGLNDSKKLSPKKRAEIFLQLKKSNNFGIGIVDEKIIDQINILNATKLAMKMAFENMCQKIEGRYKPDMVIVDGNFIPDIDCKAQAIIKGDQKSLSIAAASVIAKETRDKIMIELDKEFPQYDWKQNKGYPTKKHFAAIKEFGICKYHRQSFNHVND